MIKTACDLIIHDWHISPLLAHYILLCTMNYIAQIAVIYFAFLSRLIYDDNQQFKICKGVLDGLEMETTLMMQAGPSACLRKNHAWANVTMDWGGRVATCGFCA